MSKRATLNVVLPRTLKSEVDEILSELGMTAKQTIHLFYRQIQLNRGIPFEMRLPNNLTAKTLREGRSGKGVRRFRTKKELFADLGL